MLVYLALRSPPTAAPPPPPHLLLGVDDDSLKWTPRPLSVVRRERALGAEAVRIWVPWQGETAPRGARLDELRRAAQAAQRTNVVLAVFGFASSTPTAPAARARFCGYARAALARVPGARAVVVWNEANSKTYWGGSASDYERLLAQCYDVLHAERPSITVLDSTASAHAPGAFLGAVAAAYRASGRTAPLVDAFGHNPYPRTSAEEPATTHPPGFLGEGDYPRLASLLRRSFAGTGQHRLGIWYLEDGFQTAPPVELQGEYSGHENATTVSPEGQAERLRRAILLAACQPQVDAFFNFELVDETELAGWQSGLYWQGPTPKPAAAAFAAAAKEIRDGAVGCGAAGAAAARP